MNAFESVNDNLKIVQELKYTEVIRRINYQQKIISADDND